MTPMTPMLLRPLGDDDIAVLVFPMTAPRHFALQLERARRW